MGICVFQSDRGYLADRLSRRGTICVSLLVWSTITLLTGQVTSYDELLWTRALLGISKQSIMPSALALIADYHLSTTRHGRLVFIKWECTVGSLSLFFGIRGRATSDRLAIYLLLHRANRESSISFR